MLMQYIIVIGKGKERRYGEKDIGGRQERGKG